MTQSATTVGAVQTVLGPIAPERLGLVLPHEHILCDVTPPELKTISDREVEITFGNAHEIRYHWIKHYGNHVLNDRDVAADEVARFGSAGGGTIVELTVCGIHPDPIGLRQVSIASGVTIVAGIGFYIESFAGELVGARDVESLALEMIRGVREGIAGTDVHAGIIGEIGVSDPWTEREQRVMRAAVIAQRETGAAINVHPGRDPSAPLKVAKFVRKAGGVAAHVRGARLQVRVILTTDQRNHVAQTKVLD